MRNTKKSSQENIDMQSSANSWRRGTHAASSAAAAAVDKEGIPWIALAGDLHKATEALIDIIESDQGKGTVLSGTAPRNTMQRKLQEALTKMERKDSAMKTNRFQ